MGDPRDLMRDLDALINDARPVPLLRGQIVLDREAVYDILDRMRGSLPETLRTVLWCRRQRAEAGDPPWADTNVPTVNLLDDIDALDDLVQTSLPVPLTDSVRVKRDRLTPIVERLRAALVPLGQELADYKSIYSDDCSSSTGPP